MAATYQPRLKQKYRTEVIPALQKKFSYGSSMQVPKLQKICINQGIGDAVSDKKLIESAVKEMTTITGQKA
ncbi:MAG: 50S ribosomal protein L5, partial [Bacteroidota bacterium]